MNSVTDVSVRDGFILLIVLLITGLGMGMFARLGRG